MAALVRILVVTDTSAGGFLKWADQPPAAARSGSTARAFHLGEFLSVLSSTAWVGFNIEITKAHRGSGTASTYGADVMGFRFNQPFTVGGQTRNLADYDMVLFFSIQAGNPDSTLAPEAEAIARFMEAGGGFFATGDHANLGAPLCGLIPRVRSMRRWWSGSAIGSNPPAPDPLSADRHDTTQPGLDGVTNFEDQSDEIAQPITPRWYPAGVTTRFGFPAWRSLPHPLLCSPDGAVTWLPDHMHEGWCEVPATLTGSFTLDSAMTREYPDYTPPGSPGGFVPQPLAPEVVATGHVRAGTTSPALDGEHTGGSIPTHEKTFGLIGAWDGHRVGKGRVVVDSTWHHFFDINLTGDRFLEDDSLGAQHDQKQHGFYIPDGAGGRVPCAQYRMIQWYFRNIVYWLIPASRHRWILWSTMFELTRRPRFTEELAGLELRDLHLDHALYFGQLAEQYLTNARGACAHYILKIILYKPVIPWWEWVEEIVDVWDPLRRKLPGSRYAELTQASRNSALGLGPDPQVLARIGLGAALISAAQTSHSEEDRASLDEKRMKLAETALPKALEHFGSQIAEALAKGSKLASALTGAVNARTTGKG